MTGWVEIGSRERAALLGVLAGLFFLVYGGVGAYQAANASRLYHLSTPVDRMVSFEPVWALAYGALYPVVLSPLLILRNREVARRGAFGVALVALVGVPFWLATPVTVPRSPVAVEGTLTWGVAMIRWVDPPTNCFPSMHVAEATFASLLVRRHDRQVGNVLLGLAGLIWYASIAIEQHWFVDGLAGVAIALAVDRVVYRGLDDAAFIPRRRRWHLAWVGLYVVLFVMAAMPWWLGWVDASDVAAPW